MTDIVETPAAPVVPPFPASGASNFNEDAYVFGAAMPDVSAGIHAIGVAAHTNATCAKDAADAAVPAAAQAVAARDAAVPAAAQAVAARDAAVPAAAQALDAAQRAEAAAESIQDGPVVSIYVRGGAPKTGVVHLTAEDLNTSWGDVPNKPAVIAAGDTQAAARAAIGAMPDDALSDAPPGEFRFTDGKLDEPKWLRIGDAYLRAAYPKTAFRLNTAIPSQLKNTYSGVSNGFLPEFSPDGNRIAFVKNAPAGISVFHSADGNYAQIPVNNFPSLFQTIYGTPSIKFDADGAYMLVAVCSSADPAFSNAVVLYKNNGSSYEKVWEKTWTTNTQVVARISPDAKTILVCPDTVGNVAPFPLRFNFFAHDTLTGTVSALDVSMSSVPPGAGRMSAIEFSPEGSHLFLGFARGHNVVNDFPGYAAYRIASQTEYVRLPPIPLTENIAVEFSGFAFNEGVVALNGNKGAMSPAAFVLRYTENTLSVAGSLIGASSYAHIYSFFDGFIFPSSSGWRMFKRNLGVNKFVDLTDLSISSYIFNAVFSKDGHKCIRPSDMTLYFFGPTFSLNWPLVSGASGVYPSAQHSAYIRSWD